MKFNAEFSNKYNRKSIRLKGYNYSNEGLYFITISIKDKLCLFGEIKDNENILFESGKMIEKFWLELENKYENLKLHEFVVMPNHFHGIIEIKNNCRGAPCVRPDDIKVRPDDKNILQNNDENNCKNILQNNDENNCKNILQNNDENNCKNILQNRVNTRFTPTGGKFNYDKNSISAIIQYFKSITTNEYIKQVHKNISKPFNKKLWQRNFYEHIIRNENKYQKISEYIINNPKKWDEDLFYNNEI